MGCAICWRRAILFDMFLKILLDESKRVFIFDSALNALMIRNPPSVSSICETRLPHWFCAVTDLRLRLLPTLPIMYPAIGNSINTKMVSSQLIKSIVPRYTSIMIGFLVTISSELITEFSTSFTSPVIRAIISPLRSPEKKPRGSDSILSFICLRISRTTPVRTSTI